MKRFIFLILVLIFSSGIIFSQIDNDHLDSLFSAYINLRTGGQRTKTPSPSTISREIIKCGTSIVNELRFNFHNLSLQQQTIIKPFLQRPDLQKSIVSPLSKFRIHFDTTGSDAPKYFTNLSPAENAELVGQAFDSAYSFEVGYLQYPPPPADNGDGGDNLYDVYIFNYHSYGETDFESSTGNGLLTSYILIDNNFSKQDMDAVNTFGIDGARITAAHEFHHAIQGGNYKFDVQDRYFHELTSTSMEHFVYPSIHDYYQYLTLYFNNPQKSFSQPEDDGYSLAIWNIFLQEQFGNEGYDIIKRQWELFRNNRALTAINLSLAEHQTTFKEQLNKFGIWCYYTGYRKKEGEYFTEGADYPLIKPTYKMSFMPNEQSWYISVKPLSNNYIRILGDNGTYIDTIYSIITNGDFTAGLNSPNSNFQSQYNLFNYQAEGSNHIANEYYSKLTSSNPEDYYESDIFNNNLANGFTSSYAVIDYAFPNPFRYLKNSSIYLPVEYNRDKIVRYYIYSVSMDLMCSGIGNFITLYDKFVLPWDGLDNDNKKLPSGVYIFVTDSADKIKKGKIVIFNE